MKAADLSMDPWWLRPGALRLVTDSMRGAAFLLLDPEGRVLAWSPGARAIAGYEGSEIVGRSVAQLYSEADARAGAPQHLIRTASESGQAKEQRWCVRRDGTRFWAEVLLSSIRDESGRLMGFVEIVSDATAEHEAGERSRLILASVKDYAIFMLDASGRIVTWNPGAERTKGYRAEEVLGKHVSIFYTPEDRERGRPKQLLRLATENGRVEDEGWRVRKDGSRFWADVVITCLRDASGELIGFAKVTRDLTTRRNTQEALRQSEERLRLMLGSIRDYAILMLDPDGVVTSWSPGAELIMGYRAEEILGTHFSCFYTEEDARAGKPALELRTACDRGVFEEEGWRIRKDGKRFWANVVVSAVRDDEGRLVGFSKITRDMSERRRAEEERAARARRQAAVADIGLYALQTRDLDAVMERAADVAAATLGSEIADVLELLRDGTGFALRAAVGFRGAAAGPARIPAGNASQAGFTLEAEKSVTEDSLTESRFSTPPLFAEQGVRSGISAVIHGGPGRGGRPFGVFEAHARNARSFSEDEVHFLQAVAAVIAAAIARRSAEEQARVAEEQAEIERSKTAEARSAVRQREELISIAAHELRTPLTALQLNLLSVERSLKTAASEMDAGKAPLIRRRIENGLQHTHRLAALIERLLDLPRIATGQFRLHLEEIDLAALGRETVEGYREAALKVRSQLRYHAPSSATGTFDKTRIQEVLENLLSNAIKYGEGNPIEVLVEPLASTVRIVVTDHGQGIATEDLDRIFERFQRAPGSRPQPGLGLGLFVTRQIVAAHGGTISVASRLGEGTTFTVELPRLPAQAAAPQRAGPSQTPA